MSKRKPSLGEVLRAAREEAGFSVRQLQDQTDVDRSLISRLENDQVVAAAPRALVALAQALELRASDLFLLAGLALPDNLPSLPAMLRAEYDLPPEAIAEIQRNIERVARKYQPRQTRNTVRRSS